MPAHLKKGLRHRKSVPHRWDLMLDVSGFPSMILKYHSQLQNDHKRAHSLCPSMHSPALPQLHLDGAPRKLTYRPAYHALTGMPKANNMERPRAEKG